MRFPVPKVIIVYISQSGTNITKRPHLPQRKVNTQFVYRSNPIDRRFCMFAHKTLYKYRRIRPAYDNALDNDIN